MYIPWHFVKQNIYQINIVEQTVCEYFSNLMDFDRLGYLHKWELIDDVLFSQIQPNFSVFIIVFHDSPLPIIWARLKILFIHFAIHSVSVKWNKLSVSVCMCVEQIKLIQHLD